MSAGATLAVFTPLHNQPPTSNYATFDSRNGHNVLDFDASTDESAVFSGVMDHRYTNAGVTVYLHWTSSSADTGDVVWNAAFELIGENDQDIDSDGFAAVQAVTDAIDDVTQNGYVAIAQITFTDGAQMDSVTAGDGYRLKITRDADNASDDMAGDAELLFVALKETL